MSKKEISLQDKIKSYGNEIIELEDIVAEVRQKPDMFIGRLGNYAFITMVKEVVQNSFDEILKGVASSPLVMLTFDQRTYTVTVEDGGRGIPHGKIEKIFGQTNTSSNYVKQDGEYSAGKNGCGAAVTNMLSHKFTVDSYILGKAKHAEFIEGHMWKKGEIDIPCGDRQGTTISFVPNMDIIGEVTSTWLDVLHLVSLITPLTPIGTVLEFKAIDLDGKVHMETIESKDGIMTFIINMTETPLIAPIHFNADNGIMKAEIMFTYDANVTDNKEEVVSFNNTCPTISGTHVDGALKGICKFFTEYMNNIYFSNAKNKKLVATFQDIKVGLKLAISTFHLQAVYNAQAKETLDNKDMLVFVSDLVYKGLSEWSKSNPNDLQKLGKYFKGVIEMRLNADKEKVKLSSRFSTTSLSGGLPDKYVKPNGKKNTELIIVEGDSAFGSARNSRDNVTQGIFPIRGKMPNVFTNSQKKVLENEEVSSILSIIGAGWGKNFDISKAKVDRVIIMADADPDGAHIRTLCLRFFAVYCRPLLEAGRIYAALPPLYGIPEKKGFRFFTDKLDFVKFVQNQFTKKYQVTDIKGKAISNKDILSLLYRNDAYVDEINRVAYTYAIDPILLEYILMHRNLDCKKFTKRIKEKYRYMEPKYDKNSNTIIFSGLANDKYHEIFLNSFLLEQCKYILEYIDSNVMYYGLNGQIVSLYQLMSEFNRFVPNKLSRFKGLGEMDPDMLGVSTLRPDGDRLLVQYTVQDVEDELRQMRYINSHKDELIKL